MKLKSIRWTLLKLIAIISLLNYCLLPISAKSNKTLTIGIDKDLTGVFSPFFCKSQIDNYVIDLIYQGMMYYDYNGNLVTELLSKEPKIDYENKIIVYDLKDNLNFSDGTTLDAEDVKYTFTVLSDPGYTGDFYRIAEQIEGYKEYKFGSATELSGIEINSPTRVTFHLVDISEDIINDISTFKISSSEQTNYQKGYLSALEFESKRPVGSGPYMIKNNKSYEGGKLTLIRNKYYEINNDEYKIDKVVIERTEAYTSLTEVESGKINILPGVTNIRNIYAAEENKDLDCISYQSNEIYYLGFNLNSEVTSDKSVRQALAYSLNRQQYVDDFYLIKENEKGGYVPNILWNPNDLEFNSVFNSSEESNSYNLEKAKKLLKNKIIKLKMLVIDTDSYAQDLAKTIKNEWKDLGIKVKIENISNNDYYKVLSDDGFINRWDVFIGCKYFSPEDKNKSYNLYEKGNLLNYSRYNANIDLSYLSSMEEFDLLFKNIKNDIPYLPLYSGLAYDIYGCNLTGINVNSRYSWAESIRTIDIME